MHVTGRIHVGEANRWASRACARLSGDARLTVLVGLGLVGLVVLISMSVASVATAFGEEWLYLPVWIATTGLVAAPLAGWWQRRAVRRFRRRLMARGVSDPLAWSVMVESDGLRTRLGEVETRASWSAVSDIFPVGPFWVLLIQGTATFVPKRTFTDAGQERAFVMAVLERLTPQARARSGEAAAFAAA